MPECKVSVVSNQWVKQMEFMSAGDTMEGHSHTFDHNTLLAIGEFEVTIEGEVYEYSSPRILVIRKNLIHSIKCTSNYGLAFCLHILRDGEKVEDIIDPKDLPRIGGGLKQPLIHT